MVLKTNELSNKEVFYKNIKKMTDEQILTVLKKQADYNPLFIELAMEEAAVRGYNVGEIDFQNIDLWIIKNKSTNELVKIYVSPSDYKKEWELLAREELKKRNFNIAILSSEKENEKKVLSDGIQGNIALGYILAILAGFIGLFVAINYLVSKTKTVSGESFHKYNETTRRHAKIMLILWFVINIFVFIVMFIG